MSRKLLTTVGTIGAAILVLAGCSGTDQGSDGRPSVVTSTNVWGSVAQAVAGSEAEVTSLYTGTDDPHEYEPTAADSATVADADVIVLNGGHYDAYMEDAAKGGDAVTVNAFDIFEGDHGTDDHAGHDHGTESADDHGGESGGHDHSGHDHGGANEHVFYNLTVAAQVATRIADALAEKAPEHADQFRSNAQTFGKGIEELRTSLAKIRSAHAGTKVAQTEPLAGYLLTEAGLDDVAPESFTAAVEEGQSPSAADRATMEDLLRQHTAKALIYNTQAVDAVTEALLDVAKSANVPVVRFTETLPDGVTDYLVWQRAQIEALTAALATPPTR